MCANAQQSCGRKCQTLTTRCLDYGRSKSMERLTMRTYFRTLPRKWLPAGVEWSGMGGSAVPLSSLNRSRITGVKQTLGCACKYQIPPNSLKNSNLIRALTLSIGKSVSSDQSNIRPSVGGPWTLKSITLTQLGDSNFWEVTVLKRSYLMPHEYVHYICRWINRWMTYNRLEGKCPWYSC